MLKKRVAWLDASRALAIIAVVACHSFEGIYAYNIDCVLGRSPQSQVFAFSGFTFGRLGVPLFLFMTGYLLLDRDWSIDSCLKFWKQKWLALLACIEAWIVIYDVFLSIIRKPIPIYQSILHMFFLQNIDMGHFWYMPMIVGFYLFLPIMGAGLRRFDVSTIKYPLAILAVYLFFVPIAQNIIAAFGLSEDIPISMRLDAGFLGGVYGVYLLLGWCSKKEAFKTVPTSALVVIFVFSYVLCVSFQVWCYHHEVQYNVWYNNGMLLICDWALFELILRMPEGWFINTVDSSSHLSEHKFRLLGWISNRLAYYSFAVYLVHFPIRIIVNNWLNSLMIAKTLQVLASFSLVLFLSILICVLLSRIPRVGKRLLYLK